MRRFRLFTYAALVPLALVLSACSRGCSCSCGHGGAGAGAGQEVADAKPPRVPSETSRNEYVARCGKCHGADGTGNGPSAAQYKTKPQDFTSRDFQRGITDDEIRAMVLKGGKASGKSGLMPAYPDLARRRETLEDMVAIVRDFGPK